MEWQVLFAVIFLSLLILFATGMPVAFCFMLISVAGVFFLLGGVVGLKQLVLSIVNSVTNFAFLPLPMFVLMGEIMFHSGVAPNLIDTVDKWLGRLPGRLSLLAVGTGALFATLTGAEMASVAMLGRVLVPEMEKRGYKKTMTMGPILGSGGLAMMIPPSNLAVLLGAIGKISIGKILMAIIMPGVLMAAIYATYIYLRCRLQPNIAPPYDVPPTPLRDKLMSTVRYVSPIAIVIFLVMGLILLGVVSPSEAAVTGVFGSMIMALVCGKINWEVMKKSLIGATEITGMLLIILVGAMAFSQILAYTGASRAFVQIALGFHVAPILILIGMQVVVLIMGMFIEAVSIMIVTLPIFMPIVYALGFNDVWFAVILLINIEVAVISPPFGFSLFVMKGVAPPDTTMKDIYLASIPMCLLDLVAMALVIAFPPIALWLPGAMRK